MARRDASRLDWGELTKLAYLIGVGEGFWRMTLAEFNLAVEAYNMRQRHELQQLALHACWVANYSRSKRAARPKKLLRGMVTRDEPTSSRSFTERMREKRKREAARLAREALSGN